MSIDFWRETKGVNPSAIERYHEVRLHGTDTPHKIHPFQGVCTSGSNLSGLEQLTKR